MVAPALGAVAPTGGSGEATVRFLLRTPIEQSYCFS